MKMLIQDRRVIRSEQPCPVCGSQKWHPLIVEMKEEGYQDNTVRDNTVRDNTRTNSPTIDMLWGCARDYDECAECGTVVC